MNSIITVHEIKITIYFGILVNEPDSTSGFKFDENLKNYVSALKLMSFPKYEVTTKLPKIWLLKFC
jgi:hypothetical protein